MRCVKAYPGLPDRRLVHETVRRMINTLVTDLIHETETNIKLHAISNLDDVRNRPRRSIQC